MRAAVKELFSFADLLRRVLISWAFAVTVEYMLLPKEMKSLYSLSGIGQMSFERIAAITVVGAVLLTLAFLLHKNRTIEKLLLLGAFITLSVAVLCVSYSWQLYAVLALIGVIIALYAMKDMPKLRENYAVYKKITLILTIVFFLFLVVLSVFRYLSFGSPTYDFGIFAQMFYNMKETGAQVTTLERARLLSHFSVHISPIYYIILPIYALFPFPITLLIIQSAVMASSVIPLYRLSKKHGLSELKCMAVCALLILYPAFSGGATYDFHENCFLTPLILWLFLGIEEKSLPVTAVSLVLLLSVKEDAPVYPAVIALWLIISGAVRKTDDRKWRIVSGLIILIVSVLYFIAALFYLSEYGEGVMTGRYDNFMYDGSCSLITVIKTAVMSPMKVISECVEADRLAYIAATLIPVLGIPLMTKKYERFILLIPYILINLMPDYVYQHNIYFQYSFGSTAFIFYLVILNLSDIKTDKRGMKIIVCAGIASVIGFSSLIATYAVRRTTDYFKEYEKYTEIYSSLSDIPSDASVAATTFYTSILSQREAVYDIWYSSEDAILGCEYIVINTGSANEFSKFETDTESGYTGFVRFLNGNGYGLIYEYGSELEIYKNSA